MQIQGAITISNYGIDNWFRLEYHKGSDETYAELKLLGRQYTGTNRKISKLGSKFLRIYYARVSEVYKSIWKYF